MCVTFESCGKSKRKWKVLFELGNNEQNATAALKYAWDMNAKILKVSHED